MTGSITDLKGYCGTDYNSLRYWCNKGWLKPMKNSGRVKQFNDAEFEIAQTMCELVSVGWEPAKASKVARILQAHPDEHRFRVSRNFVLVVETDLTRRQ